MELDEKSMLYLEEHIPELAGCATEQAYWQALASGGSVLVREDAAIFEVFSDGSRKFIKKIEPSTRIDIMSIEIL